MNCYPWLYNWWTCPLWEIYSTNQYYCYSITTNPRMVQISGTGANPVGLAAHLFKRSQSFRKQSKPRNPRLFVSDQGNVWTYESIASLKTQEMFCFWITTKWLSVYTPKHRIASNSPNGFGLPLWRLGAHRLGWRGVLKRHFSGDWGKRRAKHCLWSSPKSLCPSLILRTWKHWWKPI